MKKRYALLAVLILASIASLLISWPDAEQAKPESEQAKKDRQHHAMIAFHIEMVESHRPMDAWDHFNLGLLHEWDGYYAEALAEYEIAERMGWGDLSKVKDVCRKALAGDTTVADARRKELKQGATNLLPRLSPVEGPATEKQP